MAELTIQENVPLAPCTTLGVGGPARWFCRAESESEIEQAVEFARTRSLPLFVLGGGSNLLVSDAGFNGLVLRVGVLGRRLMPETDRTVRVAAGAGEDWDGLVRFAVAHDLAGVECLAGIPGDVGATPVQNVGAYGQEVAETITSVRAFDLERSAWADLRHAECEFAYRHSVFNSRARGRYIVAGVDYLLQKGGAPALRYADLKRFFGDRTPTLAEVYAGVREVRAGKGMLACQGGDNGRSAGSFFKNPVVAASRVADIVVAAGVTESDVPHWPALDGQVKLAAAWLIERAGFVRGFTMGRAAISTQHTLALVNRGGATAAEIVALRDAVVQGVECRFGVHLEQEPVLLGF